MRCRNAGGVTVATFQRFQHEFGRHLRDPMRVAKPIDTPERRVAIYRELVFNNLRGFVDACFPVCRNLLSESRWRRLCRTFLLDWPLHTPWFRDIPCEFVRYLNEMEIRQPLPRWLANLAHYEWAELAVDVMEVANPACDPGGDLVDGVIALNPALMNLAYAWPVHRIGTDFRPRQPRLTHLVVYRNSDDVVRFSEITPPTGRLINLLAGEALSGRQAIMRLADELNHSNPQQLLGFGSRLLADLRQQDIILGSKL
ncbi:MAG: putative DNA-binding domain-containing protein [Betaproteobacteria bacterium]|nr:putative DNA-binding domain-containing protein [Betaproteobacteria bacterium]